MLKYIKYLATEKRYLCLNGDTACKITIPVIFSLLFIVLIIPSRGVSAQIPTNFAILDSLTRIAAGRICAAIGDTATITIKEHNAAWLLRVRLAEVCTNSRFSKSDTASCVIGFTRFDVHYERLSASTDSLTRTCAVAIAGTYVRSDGITASLPSSMYFYQDMIDEGHVASAEAGGYDFSRAAVPPLPGGFLRDIMEPLIVVTTAALTVFLLFSIRSQ